MFVLPEWVAIPKLELFQGDQPQCEEIHVLVLYTSEFSHPNSFYICCKESVTDPFPNYILMITSITCIEIFFD